MFDEAVNRCFFVFDSILNQYKSQEMCDRVVSKDSVLIVYWPAKYIMCNAAVDDSLAALKLVPDWSVISKMAS